MQVSSMGQVVHGQGWAQQNPGFPFSSKSQADDHNGKTIVEVVRACTSDFVKYPEDKAFWDVRIGKTWVKLEDGTEICVLNDEVK